MVLHVDSFCHRDNSNSETAYCGSWLHKNYYQVYSSPCDTPSHCNKTHEEGDQKQHSEEIIWASSLVNLVWRLVVVHQPNLYRDNKTQFYFNYYWSYLFSLEYWETKPKRSLLQLPITKDPQAIQHQTSNQIAVTGVKEGRTCDLFQLVSFYLWLA